MARIENQPKVILTQEERETLRKAQDILSNLGVCDDNGEIFCQIDNYESEWYWIDTALERLVNISEVE
jgi:hypothetical protein